MPPEAVAETAPETVAETYALETVVADVREGGWRRVALQFPDHLLSDAGLVAEWLQRSEPERSFFIVGDTSYGSCCVDEVAAAHYHADFLVHFGAACLAPVEKLPVRYVFGRAPLDMARLHRAFAKSFGKQEAVTVVCEQVRSPRPT